MRIGYFYEGSITTTIRSNQIKSDPIQEYYAIGKKYNRNWNRVRTIDKILAFRIDANVNEKITYLIEQKRTPRYRLRVHE